MSSLSKNKISLLLEASFWPARVWFLDLMSLVSDRGDNFFTPVQIYGNCGSGRCGARLEKDGLSA